MPTPAAILREWADLHDAAFEIVQEDDGSGYEIAEITTRHGRFSVTIDTTFKESDAAST